MPTGYTSDVGDGKLTSFPEFVMRCARNFGALIEMRDEPMGAPIPESLAPSSYYAKAVREDERRREALLAMTPVELELEAKTAHAAALAEWERARVARQQTRRNYEAMLAQVEAWTPPTSDHRNLKDFMRQQLKESIEFDCSDTSRFYAKPVRSSGEAWFAAELARLDRSLTYSREENQKEIERAEQRTRWVRELRSSLEGLPCLADTRG